MEMEVNALLNPITQWVAFGQWTENAQHTQITTQGRTRRFQFV